MLTPPFKYPPLPYPNPFPDRYLSFEEARHYLGNVKASTLREWTRNRRLTSYKPGKELRYLLSDLVAFMAQHVRKSHDQLTQELEQKRHELNNPTTAGATNGKGGLSCKK